MKKLIQTVIIFLLPFTGTNLFGQHFRLVDNESTIVVKGTSNLHDWEMKVLSAQCEVVFSSDGLKLTGIKKLDFSCRADALKSEYNLMDKKTWAALKADEHELIKFELLANKELAHNGNDFKGQIRGTLNVAGISRPVNLSFSGKTPDEKTLFVSGSVNLRMSDFGIKPPTALMGTLKTGDEVTVDFTLKFILIK